MYIYASTHTSSLLLQSIIINYVFMYVLLINNYVLSNYICWCVHGQREYNGQGYNNGTILQRNKRWCAAGVNTEINGE